MSRYCPILQRKVLYLDCSECENKLCRQQEYIKQNEAKETHTKENK